MKKSYLLSASLLMGICVLSVNCTKKETSQQAQTDAQSLLSGPGSSASIEPKIEDIQRGSGAEATSGKTIVVHYTGWLPDGTKFDSSLDLGKPFEFKLGAGEVIPGWDKGIIGMKEKGKRKLTIPPSLGYGSRQVGKIPPDATLIFDVELLQVK